MKRRLRYFFSAALTLLSACAVDEPREPGLYYSGTAPLPITVKVGEASAPLVFTRVTVDARGRTNEVTDYRNIEFLIQDTAIAQADGMRIVGRKAQTGPETTTVVTQDIYNRKIEATPIDIVVNPL